MLEISILDLLAQFWLALGGAAFIGLCIVLVLEWASGSDSEE